VFCSWDVEELAKRETIARLEEDRDYLKICVKGLKWARKI
jgi:Mg2+ and Co2+ transporter CorA